MAVKNFVLETANNPGTSATFNLLGAATDRLPFLSATTFSSGQTCFFYMDDDTQAEWGYGYATSGSPNTFTIQTVLGNTAGTTSRLNYTGTVRIYSEIPAERAVWLDPANNDLRLAADPTAALGAATKQYVDAAAAAVAPGRLLGVQVFTTPGTFTYTPTAGTSTVVIECQGAGGGSGGVPATGAGQVGIGQQGGAGGYGKGRYGSGFSGATVTVGAGGAAGAAGANAGGPGGASSVGALLSAAGGAGGFAGTATAGPFYGSLAASPGAVTGANLQSVQGKTPLQVIVLSGAIVVQPYGALASFYGGDTGYGAGGGAAEIGASSSAQAGNVAGGGAVVIWEYS